VNFGWILGIYIEEQYVERDQHLEKLVLLLLLIKNANAKISPPTTS